MTDIAVRQATPEEINEYILSTWLNSYALGFVGKLMRADSRHGPGREVYWSQQRAKIERILSTSTTSVRVAVLEDELVGWVCDDQTNRTVHYVFVNRVFRRQGVAKLLMPEWFDDSKGGAVFVSHLPPPWFSRQGVGQDKRPPWPANVCIDLVTGR